MLAGQHLFNTHWTYSIFIGYHITFLSRALVTTSRAKERCLRAIREWMPEEDRGRPCVGGHHKRPHMPSCVTPSLRVGANRRGAQDSPCTGSHSLSVWLLLNEPPVPPQGQAADEKPHRWARGGLFLSSHECTHKGSCEHLYIGEPWSSTATSSASSLSYLIAQNPNLWRTTQDKPGVHTQLTIQKQHPSSRICFSFVQVVFCLFVLPRNTISKE